MRRKLALLLSMVMLVGLLTGCGSKEPADEPVDEASDYDGPTGSITWCSWGSDAEIEYDQKLSELFMATHPGTTVTLEAFNDGYETTVETRYLGGQCPDVIYGHPYMFVKWIDEGMLMDISDVYEENDFLWDEDHYLVDTYEGFSRDGKYYATVAGADTFVLFYNKTALQDAGFECPTADTTWDEIVEMAQATMKMDEDGNPLVMGMDGLTWYYTAFAVIYAMGGSIFDDMINPTKVTFNSPETVKALTFIQDASNKNHFSPNGDDYNYMAGGFASGAYTFHIGGVYDIVYMTGIEDFEWDIAPLPGTMQEKGDTAILSAGYAVSSQTENPELAKEFVLWMTSDEAQELLSQTGIFTVANKVVAESDEVLNIPGAPEHHSLRVENVPYGKPIQAQVVCWNEIASVWDNYISQLYNCTITPEECAEALQTEWEALFAEEMASKG